MVPTALRCPRCRGELSGWPGPGRLRCPACRAAYPQVRSIPILVADPLGHVTRSLFALDDERLRLVATRDELDDARRSGRLAFRRGLLGRAIEGVEENLRVLGDQKSLLARSAPEAAARATPLHRAGSRARARWERAKGAIFGASLPREVPLGDGFDTVLTFLRKDWGGTAEGESIVAAMGEEVNASLPRAGAADGRALYLGAGLGRHAYDAGARFSSVVALDLSVAAAALLATLREGSVRFSSFDWCGPRSDDGLVRSHVAAFPEPPYGANVQYVVGDALAIPFADASFDAVVSLFFTDVVPSSQLLPEVRRVLRPGGRLVSVGPLHYLFPGKAEKLTREEMRHVLEKVHGFEVQPGDHGLDLRFEDAGASHVTVWRAWSFVAVRREGTAGQGRAEGPP